MKAPFRTLWLDYLRSFATLLVVAHHAAMAYPTYAFFNPAHYIGSTAPVVDPRRWAGFDVFIGFNDLFFMPLLFLLSGLFVYRGLVKKGVRAYVTDRFFRLGLPFVIAEVVLIPLAYFPAFYQATHSTDVVAFATDYVTAQAWPVGPPWFIWLLLAFDGVAALFYTFQPAAFVITGTWLTRLSRRPVPFTLVLYAVMALSLIPLSLWVGPYTWVGAWGPFDFQLSRLVFYWFFFLLGSSLGVLDWERYLFTDSKLLGQPWPFWAGLSVVGYGLVVAVVRFTHMQRQQGNFTATEGDMLSGLAFVSSCLASIGASLGFFKQKFTKPVFFWQDLSANAYAIYLVHYGFVTWLQFALLDVDLSPVIKFVFVFTGAIGLSWLSSTMIRRSARLARLL